MTKNNTKTITLTEEEQELLGDSDYFYTVEFSPEVSELMEASEACANVVATAFEDTMTFPKFQELVVSYRTLRELRKHVWMFTCT